MDRRQQRGRDAACRRSGDGGGRFASARPLAGRAQESQLPRAVPVLGTAKEHQRPAGRRYLNEPEPVQRARSSSSGSGIR